MTITTIDNEIMFVTSAGTFTMHELALLIRKQAGYASITGFEIRYGIDHPKWYNLERGRYKSVRLLLETMCELGYEINVTKGINHK